jgi:hypothetical protein
MMIPVHVDDRMWLYADKEALMICHRESDADTTATLRVPWQQVMTAVSLHFKERAREEMFAALRRIRARAKEGQTAP